MKRTLEQEEERRLAREAEEASAAGADLIKVELFGPLPLTSTSGLASQVSYRPVNPNGGLT
jgi:hypothetical protein